MRRLVCVSLAVALAGLAACSGGSGPTSPDTGPSGNSPVTPGGHFTTGTVVSAIGGGGAGAVSFTVNGTLVGLSETNGAFNVGFHSAGVNRTVLTADGFVERQTGVRAPGAGVTLTLIPSALNLEAFNQMFRHAAAGGASAALTRWTAAPKIVIERRLLQFTNLNAGSYVALDEAMTSEEAASIASDLTDGYAMLTGGLLGALSSVTTRLSDPGDAITVGAEPGTIVVTRQQGLEDQSNFWGYARWSTTADGQVTGAFLILDRDFELSQSGFRRSLRMHELGHALGAQHVSATPSVMHPNAQIEPNDFDRSAGRIAHLRPIGNRTPDIDPTSHAATTAAAGARLPETWHGAR